MTWSDVPVGTELGKKPGLGDSNWDARGIGELLADKAVDFIKRTTSESPEKPFFMCYFSNAVHHPHNPPEHFKGIPVKGTIGNGKAAHLDMIFELDLQIGEIVKALKETGQLENTLFIFTSDNGGMLNYVPGTVESGHDPTNGLRGSKGDIWEGGHRVPFIAVWPGKITAGSSSGEPVLTHDLMATMYALTGQDMPGNKALDSMNLLPVLTGKTTSRLRHEYTITGQALNTLSVQ